MDLTELVNELDLDHAVRLPLQYSSLFTITIPDHDKLLTFCLEHLNFNV